MIQNQFFFLFLPPLSQLLVCVHVHTDTYLCSAQVWVTKVSLQDSPCGSRFMKLDIKHLVSHLARSPVGVFKSVSHTHTIRSQNLEGKKKKQFGEHLVGPAWHYVGMFREDSQNLDSVKSTI